jgi:hypothetical protein
MFVHLPNAPNAKRYTTADNALFVKANYQLARKTRITSLLSWKPSDRGDTVRLQEKFIR